MLKNVMKIRGFKRKDKLDKIVADNNKAIAQLEKELEALSTQLDAVIAKRQKKVRQYQQKMQPVDFEKKSTSLTTKKE